MSNITFNSDEFSSRHNSVSPQDEKLMLKQIGVKSVDELIKLTDVELQLPKEVIEAREYQYNLI